MKMNTKQIAKALFQEGVVLERKRTLVNGFVSMSYKVEAFGHKWLIEDYESNKPKITQLEEK